MTPVGIVGFGLVSAQGADLAAACTALAAGAVPPVMLQIAADVQRPFFAIADERDDSPVEWEQRAHQHVMTAVAQADGLHDRDGALFIATSSRDAAAFETCDRQADIEARPAAFVQRIAAWLDWRGPVYCISTACTASMNALHAAHCMLASGGASSALVLGLELSNRLTLSGFNAMQLLASQRALPFGAARNGMVLGEAVAALRLVSQHAHWQLRSVANVVNGSDATGAVKSAVLAACRLALQRAGITAAQIDLVKVQAAGSVGNDAVEAAALRELFGDTMPPLVSCKSVLGHCLGAAGAAELALLCAALDAGVLPAADHEIDSALGVSLAQQVPGDVRFVLAVIIGFGGGHAAAVLERSV